MKEHLRQDQTPPTSDQSAERSQRSVIGDKRQRPWMRHKGSVGIRGQKQGGQRTEGRYRRPLTWFSRETGGGLRAKTSLFFFFLPFPLRPRPFFFPFPFPFRRRGGVSGSPWGTWEEDSSRVQIP